MAVSRLRQISCVRSVVSDRLRRNEPKLSAARPGGSTGAYSGTSRRAPCPCAAPGPPVVAIVPGSVHVGPLLKHRRAQFPHQQVPCGRSDVRDVLIVQIRLIVLSRCRRLGERRRTLRERRRRTGIAPRPRSTKSTRTTSAAPTPEATRASRSARASRPTQSGSTTSRSRSRSYARPCPRPLRSRSGTRAKPTPRTGAH